MKLTRNAKVALVLLFLLNRIWQDLNCLNCYACIVDKVKNMKNPCTTVQNPKKILIFCVPSWSSFIIIFFSLHKRYFNFHSYQRAIILLLTVLDLLFSLSGKCACLFVWFTAPFNFTTFNNNYLQLFLFSLRMTGFFLTAMPGTFIFFISICD
jgi:hypothetical protein